MSDLRVITENNWRVWRQLRLRAPAEDPAAFGATLASWQGEGDREERWRARLRDVPFNVVAYGDGPIGMISCTDADDANEAELISLWVAPEARQSGVGGELIEAVIDSARSRNVAAVRLRVYETNRGAVSLYGRHGFVHIGQDASNGRVELLMRRDVP